MRPFEYLEPKSVAEACSLLAEHGEEAKVIAGGQSLVPLLQHRLISPRYLVDIKGLTELEYIRSDGDIIRIGSLTTHRAVETSRLIKEECPMLAEMEQQVASVPIRNWGTLGGSLCHADPDGDPGVALMALGAKVKAISSEGEREIALGAFFAGFLETVLRPDEILVEIAVPVFGPSKAGAYCKEAVRAGDMAIASAAAVVAWDDKQQWLKEVHVVLGGVGMTPIQAAETEKAIAGIKIHPRQLEEAGAVAASEARPTADLRGSVDYKRVIVKVVTEEALRLALARARAA